MATSMEPVKPAVDARAWVVDGLRRVLSQRHPETTLARCLYDALRGWIQSGELAVGARLPSSRVLAGELGIGRNTALAALDHLSAEGFVVARPGAGLYVADTRFERPADSGAATATRAAGLSERGRALLAWSNPSSGASHGAFMPGVPALDAFPWGPWQRLLRRHRSRQRGRWLDYGAEGGHPALKAAVADYVNIVRNVRCRADQILITHGAQHAFDLVARMLADPGDVAWVEEPGYAGARAAFAAGGLSLAPLPVDGDGLDPAAGASDPRLMHLTPSKVSYHGYFVAFSEAARVRGKARRAGQGIPLAKRRNAVHGRAPPRPTPDIPKGTPVRAHHRVALLCHRHTMAQSRVLCCARAGVLNTAKYP
ncbi:aminotransferase class I/II-fold pyridoxal phosphate-dependent enzyme [Salinisphaera sp. RV14]|uniref:aminotransferase class I/II-fold pyridoxal phosphate-dependent enzyme n=1 Tax=Salinisphaera sp. RV14 TaxID=3454140 RepID=UPI003F828ACB